MKPIDLDAVEKAVANAEEKTCAEIIIAINRQSGSYLDRELMFAAAWALFALAIAIYSSWNFGAYWLPPDVAAIGLLVLFATRSARPVRVAVIGQERIARQTMLYARNAFCALQVTGTRDRTGLLIYVSRVEDPVVLLPDFGIEGKVPPAAWQAILDAAGPLSRHGDPTKALVDLVAACGRLLAEKLPPKDTNPDELPNRPRLEVV